MTNQKQTYLNGKPLWKCKHSELTAYAKQYGLELKPGLKTHQVASMVKKHIDANPPDVKAEVQKKAAKLSEKKAAAKKPSSKIEACRIWNLHAAGKNAEQIKEELGHAVWYIKGTIDRYAGSPKLQARAKEQAAQTGK